jgi:dTDP-glucose 4,6-dehydratase
LRLSHFLTETHRLQRELAWQPRFDLLASLRDSYQDDYALQTMPAPDFQADDALLNT